MTFTLITTFNSLTAPLEDKKLHAQPQGSEAKEVEEEQSKVPKHLFIRRLNLSLPLETAFIQNGEWQVTDKKTAFYGDKSVLPGASGTTVIFAHAKNNLFAQLPLLKKEDKIFVFSDKSLFVYRVRERHIIDPDSVDLLVSSGNNTLAIFTCFGTSNARRILFLADLKETIELNGTNSILYQI